MSTLRFAQLLWQRSGFKPQESTSNEHHTHTHTHSTSPQAIVICMGFQSSKTHQTQHTPLRTKMARVHVPACECVQLKLPSAYANIKKYSQSF